ncbi:DUF2095 domain-containing protein [Archaeoglobales archaeon]|nr:MAG: DUF2095 domain-containing protein [Archaeoglobales archaeon ex4484_92]RLI82857.1 MAG: DUF2095 domain-containing protein [Archaeoglobales archaeon]HDN73852.1 DUF2095 domain-containing protein [Archaeoglobus sp.]
MEWDREKFKKMFPSLYSELHERVIPTIFDHLEVCENEEQALEIIEYFERIGEITHDEATLLKNKVELLKGIIGTRKRGDYARRGLL